MFGTRIRLMADFHNSHSGVGLAAVVTAGGGGRGWQHAVDLRESGGGSAEDHDDEQAQRPGWTCQRVLSAVRNAFIDVKACAFKISEQGVQAADKIAAKATQWFGPSSAPRRR